MGRTKSRPTKRSVVRVTPSGGSDGDNREEENGTKEPVSFLSGRIVHPDWNALATEELLTGERGGWFSRRHVVMGGTAQNDRDDDDHDDQFKRSSNNNNKRKRREEDHVLVQTSSEEEDDDDDDDDDKSRAKGSQRRHQRLRRLRKGSGSMKQQRRKKIKGRVVRFASTTEIVEPPEIMVEVDNGDDDENKAGVDHDIRMERWKTTLWYQPNIDSLSDQHDDNAHQRDNAASVATDVFVLKTYQLPNTRLICQPITDGEDESPWSGGGGDTNVNDLPANNNKGGLVRSDLGIRYLLRYCDQQQTPPTVHGSDHYDALVDATLRGLLHISVEPDHQLSMVRVSLSVTTDALKVCCPPFCRQPTTAAIAAANMSFPASNITSKKSYSENNCFGRKRAKPETVLQKAFAVLLPNTIAEDVVTVRPDDAAASRRKTADADVITAKAVYDLVDNVRLHQYVEKLGSKPQKYLPIPGLVPTLRPYQQAAVEWMLQREKTDQQQQEEGQCYNGDEWELAWVILTNEPKFGDDSVAGSTHVVVHSLPQWKLLPKNAPSQSNIFYSPFFGWLASSWHQAKVMSIGIMNKDSTPARGGILAESMGLGKTVEVLACILANPRPQEELPAVKQHQQQLLSAIGERLASGEVSGMEQSLPEGKKLPTAVHQRKGDHQIASKPRRLVFSDDAGAKEKDDESAQDDGTLFTDDCSSDGSSDSTLGSQRKIASKGGSDDEESVTAVLSTPNSKVRQSAPFVTPDREIETPTSVSTSGNDVMEWVSKSCREPMHVKCAAFESPEQMLKETTKIVYKRRFVHDTKICRICCEDQCPSCVAGSISTGQRKPLKSPATLIVTPSSILNQWEREIQRHTSIAVSEGRAAANNGEEQADSTNRKTEKCESPTPRPLKVAIYGGVRELCQKGGKSNKSKSSTSYSGFELIHPSRLADFDVVLLTFDALMSDLGHSDENPYAMSSSEVSNSSGKLLRGKKRYRVAPSPLSAIDWWRVCLDEAQRVETTTAACARMALKLLAQHRWCVSGTPIGKGKLDDLYGLLLFLRLQPFCEKPWFDKCFSQSHRGVGERIKHLLDDCFWRSTKGSELVRLQMGVPEQIEKKVILRFSSIEKHFYDRQLEETLAIATDSAGNGAKRKASQLDQLSVHVHKLRAACCHPQVGSSGIGRFKKRRKGVGGQKVNGDNSPDLCVGTVVLTMDQILDRLIDDARLKCEEAQRLTLMHTNGMAALAKLKVEAKQFGCEFKESDAALFLQSCKLYRESLDLTEENGKPSRVVGEAVLSGSQGFRSSHKIIRDGQATLDWQIKNVIDSNESIEEEPRQVWARFDFEGPSKRIIEIRVRSSYCVPKDLVEEDQSEREILFPKDCLFQVASSAVGGEFVDVCHFTMPQQNKIASEIDWTVTGGFRTNKSKSWRVIVLNYHECVTKSRPCNNLSVRIWYVGIEVELCEADIANDPLQRLHIMHNAIVSSECLLQISRGDEQMQSNHSWTEVKSGIDKMQNECQKIESLYMDSARALHQECQRRLGVATDARQEQESLLMALSRSAGKRSSELVDCWADEWWSDLLIVCTMHGTAHDQKSLCDLVRAELDSFLHGGFQGVFVGISTNRVKRTFPDFNDLNGILAGLNLRMLDHRDINPPGGHTQCMEEIGGLSPIPTEAEFLENSRCRECKADWNQKGEVCRFCKMGKRLSQLEPDRLLLTVLKSLWIWTRGIKKSSSLLSAKTAARIDERAKKFFDVLEANKKEISAAHRAWRVHIDLMNDLDELNSCKRTMRLAQEGEDLTQYTEDELRSIVMPFDVASTYLDHAAKQAMALANLRRQKHILRYLKNQNLERLEENGAKSKEDQTCVVCLSRLEGDTAVLHCGHSFHNTPCFERLIKRHGNHQNISCPLRCSVRTKRDEVMIASDKRNDDGSRSKREIKGSWGTKVTRLVADVMDAADLGEKSIVFSMWEDMLEVVDQALTMNGVGFVRVKTSTRIGECTRQFRSVDCSVLLLNVKLGAEGLTLVEATHVFMVEPLLNCGLDSQAINRIHRIGQTCKTLVHRYLIQDTIEMKIDKMRMERQADQLQLEDAIHEAKKKHDVSGGGIDGGFTEAELQDLLH